MAFDALDWTIGTNGDIRYIGNAHTGGSPTYATVIEFHRALQDFADDALAAGDDLLDISSLTPSDRSTDNIITLLNGYNIDQTSAEHLYDGSIIQTGGDDIWDGIVNFGNPVFIIIHQDGAVLANDFWNDLTPAGFNADAAAGISHRFMVKTRTAGTDIDGRRLLGLNREFLFTFGEFSINGTSRGNNVLDLSEATDLNNQTAAVTVATWTSVVNSNEGYSATDLNNQTAAVTVATWTSVVNSNEGYSAIDVTGDTVNEFYYSNWTVGTQTINDFYERLKWASRRGTAETLYGLTGDLFRGITHEVEIDTPTGTFVEPEAVSWPNGTGQLLAIDSVTAGTKMWIQLLSGIPPVNNELITGVSTATALVNITVTSRSLSTPFVGASTGSAIIGSYGLGILDTDLTASDTLFDLDNTQRTPPNNVTFTVSGLVVGEDRILVTKDNASAIDKAQLSLNTTLITGTETAVVTTAAIPTDTPAAGTLRVVNDSGFDRLLTYTSYTGSTFTITSADFSGADELDSATAGVNVYVTYIDKLAGATSESFTSVYLADLGLFIRVRDGGASPIKTFETTGVLGGSGGSSTAIRTSDA